MLNLGSTNAECESAKCTMGGGMGVTTDDSGAWKGEALFRTDDVDDTLALVAEAEVGEAKGLHVFFESEALGARVSFLNKGFGVCVVCARGGRDVLGSEYAMLVL